ncbi:hypothetical protein HPB49_023991 [Dermacentor silvarum]|uniref:Uncharacterized protein n=1 Tax=Dermacentor silvarum TaxID=543639 RepID=A0ACB8E4J4_DERSI|nr:hypothetical protein HPB49_023991 [Dermacentor silvarum]
MSMGRALPPVGRDASLLAITDIRFGAIASLDTLETERPRTSGRSSENQPATSITSYARIDSGADITVIRASKVPSEILEQSSGHMEITGAFGQAVTADIMYVPLGLPCPLSNATQRVPLLCVVTPALATSTDVLLTRDDYESLCLAVDESGRDLESDSVNARRRSVCSTHHRVADKDDDVGGRWHERLDEGERDRPISGGHETTGCGTRNEEKDEEETGTLEERSFGVGVQGSLVSRSVSSGSRPEPESLNRTSTTPAVPGEIHRA